MRICSSSASVFAALAARQGLYAWTVIATNIIGTLVLGGSFASLIQVVDNSTSLLTRFTLAPVPLFILMGALFFH